MSKMKNISPEDERCLDAAEGWLGLGDYQSANEELDQVTPELRVLPEVLLLRLQIYWAANKWSDCVTIADAVMKLEPDNDYAWIGRSFALHEMKQTQEAYDLLLPAQGELLFRGLI